MKKLHVRKDDEVVVISGNDKGKRGKVISALSATQVAAARLPSARTARKSEYALSAAQSFNRR